MCRSPNKNRQSDYRRPHLDADSLNLLWSVSRLADKVGPS